MCKKRLNGNAPSGTIDPCLRELIEYLKFIHKNCKYPYTIIASCCGHGRYSMSLIVRNESTKEVFDMMSNTLIPRKKRFYKKDKEGYFYIPEVLKGRRRMI